MNLSVMPYSSIDITVFGMVWKSNMRNPALEADVLTIEARHVYDNVIFAADRSHMKHTPYCCTLAKNCSNRTHAKELTQTQKSKGQNKYYSGVRHI